MAVFLGLLWVAPGYSQKDEVANIANQAPAKIDEFAGVAQKLADRAPHQMEQFEEVARALAEKSKEQVQKDGMEAIRPLFPDGKLPEKSTPAPKTASILPAGKDSRLLLFITLGPDPDSRLEQNRRLLQEVPPGTEVILRGLPHGKRGLGDLFRYVHKLTGDRRGQKEKMPRVLLDPRLYRQYAVDVSPTMVYERKGKAVAWVRGLVNSQWLKDQVEKDKRTGDLGKYGPTEAIEERDFLEEIQERLASIDWDARKEKAWEQYWTHYSFLTLPPANNDRVYQVEAVYEVPQDFRLPDGKVLARKGDKINLFDRVKPRFVLLVFDGSVPRQLAWAKKAAREFQGRYRVQYLTTALPERTWHSFSKLEEKLEAPLYLLNDAVRERFRLEHSPAIVRPLADRFEVQEISLKKEKDQGGGDATPGAH
ncbi:MAG: TrbC family F-type conjugative pilus assembly protein [Thermodesulfobacteriota bacterium]